MRKPFVFFDLGETLVDLRDLLVSLAAILSSKYPVLQASAPDLVRHWIVDASRQMPRGPNQPFVPEFEVASDVMARLLRARGIEIESEAAGLILRMGWDDFETRVRFVRGVTEDWLQEIRDLSSAAAIVTDGDRENVNRLLRRLPLGRYFDSIITSEDVQSYKPNAQIYEAALRSLHATPEESIFISDAALDLQGAAALGMATCLFGRQIVDASRDLPEGSFCVPDPPDLVDILRGFAAKGRFDNGPTA